MPLSVTSCAHAAPATDASTHAANAVVGARRMLFAPSCPTLRRKPDDHAPRLEHGAARNRNARSATLGRDDGGRLDLDLGALLQQVGDDEQSHRREMAAD